MLKEYMDVKKGGIIKFKTTFSDYLNVGSNTPEVGTSASSSEAPNFSPDDLIEVIKIVDPGEFYVICWCEREHRNDLLEKLDQYCDYETAKEIKINNTYAIHRDGRWIRATIGDDYGYEVNSICKRQKIVNVENQRKMYKLTNVKKKKIYETSTRCCHCKIKPKKNSLKSKQRRGRRQ